jgi:hypothetical protein
MTNQQMKDNSQRIKRFNQELETQLGGHPVDPSGLTPEDQRALELADSLAGMDLAPPATTRQRLRWRLISQAKMLEQTTEISPPLEKLHLAISRMALILLFVLVGLVFSNLAGLTRTDGPANATAYASDSLPGEEQSGVWDTDLQGVQIAPKIIPTPIAPITSLANTHFSISSTDQSSPGTTEWSPTLIPIETP